MGCAVKCKISAMDSLMGLLCVALSCKTYANSSVKGSLFPFVTVEKSKFYGAPKSGDGYFVTTSFNLYVYMTHFEDFHLHLPLVMGKH